MDAFNKSCPICALGKNSQEKGGNINCFHCDNCGFIECMCFPKEDGDPVEFFISPIRARLTEFFNRPHETSYHLEV